MWKRTSTKLGLQLQDGEVLPARPVDAARAPSARPRPLRLTLQRLMSPLAKAVFVSTASSVLSGYDQGVIAAAMLTMRDDLALSGVQEEMAIGVMNIAAAGGGLVAGVAAEALGRKRALWLANIFFLVGSIAISLAGGFVALLIGRMLQGVGVGFALVVAPIFTAELVPAEQRGRLVSLGDVCTNSGILLGYCSGLLFLNTVDGWRAMFAIGCVPAVLIGCSISTAPESPRWLVSVGRVDDARAVLRRLEPSTSEDGGVAAERTLTELSANVAALNAQPKSGWADVLWHPDRTVRGMIWRGLAIALFSQMTGTEAVVYYAGDIVQDAGVESVRDTLLAITAVGMCKLVFLLISSPLFDRLGRRPMLLASAAGLTMSLLILSFASQGLGRGDGGGARPALAIFGLCAYMASFSIGFSPLVYVICSELFPLGVRARAMSCALFATRVTAGAISSSFVSMRAALTPAGAWLVFVPIALGAFCFTYAFIPETRGLGLEDVQRMFEDLGAAKIATAGGKGGGGGACGGGRGCAIGLRRRRPGTRDVEATPAQQLSTHEDEDDDSIATWREVERSISRNHVELAARGAAVAALPVPGDAGAY